jgi:hypothetical protein
LGDRVAASLRAVLDEAEAQENDADRAFDDAL